MDVLRHPRLCIMAYSWHVADEKGSWTKDELCNNGDNHFGVRSIGFTSSIFLGLTPRKVSIPFAHQNIFNFYLKLCFLMIIIKSVMICFHLLTLHSHTISANIMPKINLQRKLNLVPLHYFVAYFGQTVICYHSGSSETILSIDVTE